MHKEHQAQDENSNPRDGRRKEHDMNQLNRSRPKTGSWESNGFGPGPEIETIAGRTEDSVPLSPSNSLNLRHLRGCEKDPSGRPHQRSPSTQYHPNYYPTHHHHYRPSYSGHRKGYWDYESQYRDGKRKAWVPRPGAGGAHTQRPRNREALSSTESTCAEVRPEQSAGEKNKTVPVGAPLPRQPSPPAEKEAVTDNWLLFKPLPVFPVDSSSARTQPKISYASKVKENLDSKGLVPGSALRTANALPNCLLSSADPPSHSSSPVPTQPSDSLSSSSCSSLSSTPPSPVCQENLGAIFQNEWGLSFINEPGAGESCGGVEGGGSGAPPISALDHLCHGFFLEGAHPEEVQMDNPQDWEAMVTYNLREWSRVWALHKKDPSRVVVYAESMDGKG